MSKKVRLMLGDEAIAQGAIDAGISGMYAYPGTPSTEIMEYVQNSPIAAEDRDGSRPGDELRGATSNGWI